MPEEKISGVQWRVKWVRQWGSVTVRSFINTKLPIDDLIHIGADISIDDYLKALAIESGLPLAKLEEANIKVMKKMGEQTKGVAGL